MFSFEKLTVYNKSLDFIDRVYEVTLLWPKREQFGLINQVERAAVSIALNIAEGSSRTKKDFRHFLDLSRGSCFECVAILTIARRRRYISAEVFNELYQVCTDLSKMISGLKNSIQ